jgi:hypothetical protein
VEGRNYEFTHFLKRDYSTSSAKKRTGTVLSSPVGGEGDGSLITYESIFTQFRGETVRYHSGGSMELNARILLLAYMVYL